MLFLFVPYIPLLVFPPRGFPDLSSLVSVPHDACGSPVGVLARPGVTAWEPTVAPIFESLPLGIF